MSGLDLEWENYFNNVEDDTIKEEKQEIKQFTPKCSDIYISTRTKTGALNKEIDLENVFWKLPVIKYQDQKVGILKKIIKINCKNEEETAELEKNIATQENITVETISKIDNKTGNNIMYKDIRKIIVGISKKDLINFRKKKKSAFYNCFSIIIRIKHNGEFKEINIKLFNTGNLKIPGIKDLETLTISVNLLVDILNKQCGTNDLKFLPEKTKTVLINSNFTCNFYIIRNKLHSILKFKYNIHCLYDPCSYPGIQCKFFYNPENTTHNGICNCKNKCEINNKKKKKFNKCSIISFMIFRTGSILIVGNCDEHVLRIIYKFIVNILMSELGNGIRSCYDMDLIADEKKNKKEKKFRKRNILVSK